MDETETLFRRESTRDVRRAEITGARVGTLSALLLDRAGESLVGGTNDGRLLHWDIRDSRRPRLMGTYDAGASVTALAYLIGDRSLVVGTAGGTVAVWLSMLDPAVGGDPRLRKIRDFAPHDAAVTAISPSLRDKGFLTADAAGAVAVHYSTSHQTLITIPGNGSPVLAAMFAPKTNGAIVIHEDGRLVVYDVENDHPEATFSSLFLPVLYEGYDAPLPMWQSTGGSDAFESKFGLWPLIFGTLKGTLYAMLLATPIAVLGAIYTAMFMHPAVRAVVKPVVETMAAFPTVIPGFPGRIVAGPPAGKNFSGRGRDVSGVAAGGCPGLCRLAMAAAGHQTSIGDVDGTGRVRPGSRRHRLGLFAGQSADRSLAVSRRLPAMGVLRVRRGV